MNLLTPQSCKRLEQYFKFIGQFANYKQFSYLSFFVNQKGDKLMYDQELNFASLYKDPTQFNRYSLEEYLDTINLPFLYRKCLLTGLFNNHILTYKETQNILQNCVNLDLQGKKDMANFMFGNRVSYDLKNWINNFKNGSLSQFSLNFSPKDGKLPDEKRKNYFIIFEDQISHFNQLQEKISQNDFFNIPNINKVLCLDLRIEKIHQFNNELLKKEGFFKEKDIKIKNIASDKIPQGFQDKSLTLGFRIHRLFEYISKNMKGNTLLHQLPEYYKFYNESEKLQSTVKSNVYRFEPKQTFLFLQRKREIEGQNTDFTFGQFSVIFDEIIKKNFTKRFQKDPYFGQNESGLQTVRYLSNTNKTKNIKMIKMQQKGTPHIANQ